jgi:farnesyl-diphosphate farnesyltransferase
MPIPELSACYAYQLHSLNAVSRTFALTIPQLPQPLAGVVGNAYLLCRIADTIEDDIALSSADKDHFAHWWCDVVSGTAAGDEFAHALIPCLGATTTAGERDLIQHSAWVVRLTHSFSPRQQALLLRCVRIMSAGMAEFQRRATPHGLPNGRALDDYCYYVAGVVGEMLMELFCDYEPEFAAHGKAYLRPLSISFGQGLQMTNILKDIWDDQVRGVCWLPRDHFGGKTPLQADSAEFQQGMDELIGLAVAHLRNALTYILCLPRHQRGLRRFCLWALGMALLTLRRIYQHPGFRSNAEVKISRRSVKAVIIISNLATAHDKLLHYLFKRLVHGLPYAPPPHIKPPL